MPKKVTPPYRMSLDTGGGAPLLMAHTKPLNQQNKNNTSKSHYHNHGNLRILTGEIRKCPRADTDLAQRYLFSQTVGSPTKRLLPGPDLIQCANHEACKQSKHWVVELVERPGN